MQVIPNTQIGSTFDFDHGEGSVTFSWLDVDGIDRSLTVDIDGHCNREMPIRSGTGVSIASVLPDRVRLRFTPELATRLELKDEVEFEGNISEETYEHLLELAEYL